MVNETYKAMLQNKSVIMELAAAAKERAKVIGRENVFDYSMGSPSVPCPQKFTDTVIDMYKTEVPMDIHGYSPATGNVIFRTTVAESLNRRFNMNYNFQHIFPATGAQGALAHALRVITKPGDEVITFLPCFTEYFIYVNEAGARLTAVPANMEDFQINFEAFEKALNPNVQAVLINSPNNPSGAVYSTATIKRLAAILEEKQKEYGHEIFIISDDPYREIVYAGVDSPYISNYYDNSISCYSYSKSLSLAGERIGYCAVNPKAKDAELLAAMMAQVSRGIGHNCPPSTMQLAVAKCVDITSEMSVYETNMNLLYDALTGIGFDVVKPGGTFYIFPKALEEDAKAFAQKALKYDLVLVPSDDFGVKGYFRMAYCIDTEKVKRSIPVIEKFAREVYGMKC